MAILASIIILFIVLGLFWFALNPLFNKIGAAFSKEKNKFNQKWESEDNE